MKVAFLVGRFPVLSEVFIVNQITGLLDRGHEVDIYALSGSSGEMKVHPDVERYELLSRTYYAPKLPDRFSIRLWQALKLLLRWGHRDALLFARALNVFRYGKKAASLRLFYLAVPFLGRKSYNIVHCQFGTYGLLGLALRDMGALTGKLVTTFRGYDISEYPRRHGEDIYHPLFSHGDLFFSNCDFFRQRVIKLGGNPDKTFVHRSSIDCNKFAFKPRKLSPQSPIRLATVGRLTEKKGIEYGIRAVGQLVEAGFDVRYDIVGEGHLRSHLEQLIQDLDLCDRVNLLGKKQQTEIIEFLTQAHIFIAPCVTASSGDQDAPINTLKEAMAMGLPVVSTWHGGIPELVDDGISGYLVQEEDPDAIAERLIYLITHAEDWPSMGKAGRMRVMADYEMEQLNNELVMHYEQLRQDLRLASPVTLDSPQPNPVKTS